MTPEVIKKLEEAFAIGASDREACFYADITPPTLYDYQRKNPDFLIRKEALKERPVLMARQKVVDGIKEDVKNAQWYLERRKKDEFGNAVTLDGNVAVSHVQIEIVNPDKPLLDGPDDPDTGDQSPPENP